MEIAADTRLNLYEGMIRARYFEKRAYDLFMQGLVKGTTHLGLGQEAVAAGFAEAMQPDDMSYCTYRGHNHTLLRGAPMGPLMGELMGKANGICAGKGGSMHMFDRDNNLFGGHGIVLHRRHLGPASHLRRSTWTRLLMVVNPHTSHCASSVMVR